jgi:hypothetical protein
MPARSRLQKQTEMQYQPALRQHPLGNPATHVSPGTSFIRPYQIMACSPYLSKRERGDARRMAPCEWPSLESATHLGELV